MTYIPLGNYRNGFRLLSDVRKSHVSIQYIAIRIFLILYYIVCTELIENIVRIIYGNVCREKDMVKDSN